MTLVDPSGRPVDEESRRRLATWLRSARVTLIESFGAIHGLKPEGGSWPDEASAEKHRSLVCQAILKLLGGKGEIEERFAINLTVRVVDENGNDPTQTGNGGGPE